MASFRWPSVRVLVVGWLTVACSAAHAVNLTISPSSVRNDYVGPITFTVTGLALGQSVQIDRFADLNGNGSVDVGEPLTEGSSFTLTDGQMSLIDGVRNLNIPGDDDGVENGSITATVFFQPSRQSGTGDEAPGAYLYELSDPAQGTSLTSPRPFTVSQDTTLPQGITGTVMAAAGGQPLAALVLVAPAGSNRVYSAVTDTHGQYTIYTNPGTYTVQPLSIAPGYIASPTLDATMVPPGQFVTQDFTLAAAGLTVSGTVSDSVTGAGLPGVGVSATSSTGVAADFTDRAGRYSFQVTNGDWRVFPDQASAERIGYVGFTSHDVTTINSSVTIDFQFPKATALIYGTVLDNQGSPVIGINMRRIERSAPQGHTFLPQGHTLPPSGNYSIGVFGGSWWVGPDEDELNDFGCAYPDVRVLVAPSDGQAVRQDFTLQCTPVAPTPTPTPSPTPPTCVGDCNGNRSVTVDELLTMVNIALGTTNVSQCAAGDANGDHQITIDEILTAVNNALNGCGGG